MNIKLQPKNAKHFYLALVAFFIFAFATVAISNLFTLKGSAAAQTANLWMDADGGSCIYSATPAAYNSATACDSFSEACTNIQAGKTMLIKGGTYTGSETSVSNCSKTCSLPLADGSCDPSAMTNFTAADGETASTTAGTYNKDSNLSIGGLYMNMAGNGNGPGVFMTCSTNLTIHDTEIEGDHAQGTSYGDAVQVWPLDDGSNCYNQRIKLDKMFIHDLHTYVASEDNHTDCIQAASAQGLTLTRSRLVNCGTQSFQLNADKWPCAHSGCALLADVTMENNWIGMGGTVGGLTNLTVRGNSFSETPHFDNGYNKGVVTMVGNIFNLYSENANSAGYQCGQLALKGVASSKTFMYNLSNDACPGSTNKLIQAYSNNISTFFNALFINASTSNATTWDLHLKTGVDAKALNGVPANLMPTLDYDGGTRVPDQNGNVDIGADEFGVVGDGTGTGGGGGGGGGGGTTATYHSADLTNLLNHYGVTTGMTTATGDLNGDGAVNIYDLGKLLSDYSP